MLSCYKINCNKIVTIYQIWGYIASVCTLYINVLSWPNLDVKTIYDILRIKIWILEIIKLNVMERLMSVDSGQQDGHATLIMEGGGPAAPNMAGIFGRSCSPRVF